MRGWAIAALRRWLERLPSGLRIPLTIAVAALSLIAVYQGVRLNSFALVGVGAVFLLGLLFARR